MASELILDRDNYFAIKFTHEQIVFHFQVNPLLFWSVGSCLEETESGNWLLP